MRTRLGDLRLEAENKHLPQGEPPGSPVFSIQVYLGREPVGNGQAPEGFKADLIPGVAAVDGAALVAVLATGLLAVFFTAALAAGFAAGFAAAFFTAGLAAAFLTATLAATFFTAAFAAGFAAGFATAFFTAGLAAVFLTAGFLAADAVFAPDFLALVAIPTSFDNKMNKNYLKKPPHQYSDTSTSDLQKRKRPIKKISKAPNPCKVSNPYRQ